MTPLSKKASLAAVCILALPALSAQAAEISTEKDAEIQRLKGTYESLVKDLKGEIEKGEIKVTQIRDRLTVNLVEKILFDSGKAEVKAQGKEVLKKVGNILKDVKDKHVKVRVCRRADCGEEIDR